MLHCHGLWQTVDLVVIMSNTSSDPSRKLRIFTLKPFFYQPYDIFEAAVESSDYSALSHWACGSQTRSFLVPTCLRAICLLLGTTLLRDLSYE